MHARAAVGEQHDFARGIGDGVVPLAVVQTEDVNGGYTGGCFGCQVTVYVVAELFRVGIVVASRKLSLSLGIPNPHHGDRLGSRERVVVAGAAREPHLSRRLAFFLFPRNRFLRVGQAFGVSASYVVETRIRLENGTRERSLKVGPLRVSRRKRIANLVRVGFEDLVENHAAVASAGQ